MILRLMATRPPLYFRMALPRAAEPLRFSLMHCGRDLITESPESLYPRSNPQSARQGGWPGAFLKKTIQPPVAS